MRKITLFLALMVAMVTTTMAQTVVTKLSDFSAEKCYTVTTTTRGGWAVMADTQGNYTQFCSTNDAGTMLTEEAQRFAVLTADNENYYLYSVAAKKFVKHDRSLNAKAGDAIEFTEAGEGRVRVNFKGIANSYINLGGSNQMSIDGWGTIDVGNSVQFLEVADFDATEALAALAAASFEQSLADVLGNTKVITECPEGVVAAKTAEGTAENCESTTIKRALQNVKLVEPTTVTVNFKYTTGNHKLIMLGVDLVNAEGTVVASDYHFGFTGGSHKDNTYTLDATAVAAGDYTLRYFFCHKANDHEVGNQQAKISVEGLKYVVTLPEGVVADPAELSATALYQIVPQDEARGALYALPESEYLTATKGKDVTAVGIDPADANQQFMFVENDGKMYLYAVGAGKFVNDEDKFLNLTAEPDHFVTVEKADAPGFMFVKMNGVDMINVSGGYDHSGFAAWNNSDSGNNLRITLVGEADEATLAAIEAAFNPVVELAALEPTSFERNPLETAYNGQYKLQGVKLNFDVVVKKYTTDLSGDYGYILDAEGNEVARLNKCMGGNGTANTFATPYAATAIQTPGTYKVVVLPDVILSADGTAAYKGGEFEFTVAERAVEITPSAEEGFCWNETYNKVADFSEFIITVNYAKNDVVINNDVKATMTTGETVYEATVTVEKYGTTQEIKLAFAPAEGQEFAEGRYTINVPAGLFTVDGTANAEFAKSTFTYKKPALEIARDFDTWVDYIDELWAMPKTVMIKIANAESVEVDETKLATIAFGETVYTSAISWYYDDWSNAYYIEYTFEDFANTWDENGEFVEYEFAYGDYTFTLPAGAYTVNGEANEEAVKNYTYGAPIVEEFWINSITPANGSKLQSIEAIAIEFSNGLKPDILYITNKETETRYTLVYNNGVYVPVDFNYEAIVIKDLGTYTLDLSELVGLIGNKVFTWTIAAPEVTVEIDATKEYYLYTSYNSGMNSGYLAVGNKTGDNYGNVYLANDKATAQAFKFTLVEDGANKYYTLSYKEEAGTGVTTKYINCTHSWNVNANNTPSNLLLEMENATSTKYLIKTGNGYMKASKIDYGTEGWAYHVFSDEAVREKALVWKLEAVEAEVPVVAAPKITAIYPAENEPVDCVSELVLTFDKEIKEVDMMKIQIKIYLGTTLKCRVYGWNADIQGNVVTIAITDDMNNALDLEEVGEYTIKVPAGFVTSVDGAKCEDAEFKFTISEQIETAIENVEAAEEAVIYDITGRRIAEITKPGIYVVNGKKVLVK